MRITFKKIEIHNFMCFEDEVFEFPENPGLNLICGKNNDIPGSKNGSGKSAFSESLCYALYGQTRNSISNGNIHNKYVAGKDVRVVAYFDVDQHRYKSAAGFHKNGGAYHQLFEITDKEEIDMTKSSIIETRKFIAEELLHCDISMFLRTIILSSDQNYNFFKLRKGEKKEFIEKLFDISVFGDMYNNIHKDILNYDKSILAHQNKVIVLNKTSDDYKTRIEKYDSENSNKLKTLNESLLRIQTEYDLLKNKNIKSNSEEVEKYENAIDKLNEASTKLLADVNAFKTKNSKIEVALHKIETSKESKQKMIDKHQELLDKLCDDCKPIFSDYYNITTYKNDIDELKSKANKLNDEYSANDKQIKTLNEKIDNVASKTEKARLKIKELSEEFNKTTKELTLMESRMASIERDIENTKNESNPYIELLESCKKDIENETTQLCEIEEQYKYLSFAENIVSQDTLRKFIISDLIGLLNNKIKMYLTKFGAKYHVVFDSDMNYEFVTQGGEYEYNNFSAGERARIMIAACFAFRDFMYIRNNISSNVLILDEFIDGAIDSIAIESILDILKEFSTAWNQNIYVVSHRKEVGNDVFNRIIQIQKTNNISKICYLENN